MADMPDTVDSLVRDLVASVAPAPRPYDEVMAAWRTSCPRLPVWETAVALGYVARRPGGAGRPAVVEATDKGRAWLAGAGAVHPNPAARRIAPEAAAAPGARPDPGRPRPVSRNVETVKTIYERFGAGDIPGILALCAADIEWEHDRHPPILKWYVPRRGRQNIVGFFESLADFDFLRFEPQAFLDGGNQVAVPVQIELRVKANGKVIRDLELHLFTFGADGLVTRFRHFVDTHQFAMQTA
jgi:uncharacterized protein